MPEYDKSIVTPLLRRRAHLVEVGADAAKVAELNHALRMAGYPVDDESSLDEKRVIENKPGVPRAEDEQPPSEDPSEPEAKRADDEAKAKAVKPMQRSSKPVQTAASEAEKPGVTSDFLSGKPRKASE